MATQKYLKINGVITDYSNAHGADGSFSTSAPAQSSVVLERRYDATLPIVGQSFEWFRTDDVLMWSGVISSVQIEEYAEGSGNLVVTLRAVGKDDRLYRRSTWDRVSAIGGNPRTAHYRSWTGVVDTVDAAGVGKVTWNDGDKFSLDLVGAVVTIDGAPYTVASVESPHALTLTGPIGTKSAADFARIVYSGDAVKDLIDTFLEFEGFTYTVGSIQNGAAFDSSGVLFDPPVMISDAIQTILGGNPGFVFNVDENQVCYFAPYTFVPAPADMTPTSGVQKRGIQTTITAEDVRNVEISNTTFDAVDETVDNLVGDGSTRAWFLTGRIHDVVKAELNGVEVNLADGTTGNTGDFYYQPNDGMIWQDPTGVVLTGGDTLAVHYKKLWANLLEYADDAARSARQAIEGTGFGRYEQVIDRTSLPGKTAALAESVESVGRLKDNYYDLTIKTFEKGYRVGQVIVIDMPKVQANSLQLFIDEIAFSDAECKGSSHDWEYSLRCISVSRRITELATLRDTFSKGPGGTTKSGGFVVGGGGGGGGDTPQAPNVSATATAWPHLFGNDSVFGFQGTITLPTGDPNYSHLKRIDVYAYGQSSAQGTLVASFSDWVGGTINYQVGDYPAPTVSDNFYALLFVASDENGTPTPSPFVVSSILVYASKVNAVSGFSEPTSNDFIKPEENNRLNYCWIDINPTVNGGVFPQNVTVAISKDGGTNYTYIGWYLLVSASVIRIWTPRPAAGATYYVAAHAGALQGNPQVQVSSSELTSAGWVFSAGITLLGLATPASNQVSAASIVTLDGTHEYLLKKRPDGTYYGEIGSVQYTAPGPTNLDFFIRITVQDLDASHNPVGPEKPHAGSEYTSGTTYTTPDHLLVTLYSGLAYIRYRVYLGNRGNQTSGAFQDATTNTLQAAWSGGATFHDVPVTLPAGLDARLLDPGTVGQNIGKDASGRPVTLTDDTANKLLNGSFDYEFQGWDVWNPAKTPVLNPTGGIGGGPSMQCASPTGYYLMQLVTAREGDVLYADAHYWATGGADGGAFIFAYFLDAAGTDILGGPVIAGFGPSGTSQSAQGTVFKRFDPAPPGTVQVRFLFGADGGTTGVFNIDDCRVQKVGNLPWQGTSSSTGLVIDSTGAMKVQLAGALAINGSNQVILSNSGVQAIHMATDAINTANVVNGAITDAKIGSVNISKLVAGTALFTGNVIMSRGPNNPILFWDTSGLYLFGQADASVGNSGLTTKPYVVINSSGIGLYTGGNATVTLNGNNIVLWSLNGNTNNAYVSISASAMTLSGGGTNATAQLAAGGLNLFSSGTNTAAPYVQIGTSGIGISGGGSNPSMTIAAGGITLQSINGSTSAPYVTITSSQITLLSGGNPSLALSSSWVRLYSVNGNTGFPYVQINSGGMDVVSGGLGVSITSTFMSVTGSGGARIFMYGIGQIQLIGSGPLAPFTVVDSTGITTGTLQLEGSGALPCLALPSINYYGTAGGAAGYVLISVGGTSYKVQLLNP